MRAVSAFDAAGGVVLATFLAAVTGAVRVTQPEARPVTAAGVVLLVACGLALTFWRGFPVPVFVLSVGAAVAYLALRFAGWPVYIGAFAGLLALVYGVADARRWVPLAAVGGVGIAVATGPPEGWRPSRMITVGLVWAVVAVLAARSARVRRRLAEEEAAGRVVEERLRIARELHDVLSHSLASVSLQAGVGLHLLDRQPAQAREALQAIRQISNDGLAQARAALKAVRGGAPGLVDLPVLVASVRASGVMVDLQSEFDGVDVPRQVDVTAYRVVQEALTNVMRHAKPGVRAQVRVVADGEWLEVDVTDDGEGVGEPTPGHGLRGMSERVDAAGGELAAGPEANGGFGVHARLPLTEAS